MPRIEIIAPPEGDAPEAMRHAWVGCIMPSTGLTDAHTQRLNIATGEPSSEQCPAYIVEPRDALHALNQTTDSAEAMRYWEDRCDKLRGSKFLFNTSICREIDP